MPRAPEARPAAPSLRPATRVLIRCVSRPRRGREWRGRRSGAPLSARAWRRGAGVPTTAAAGRAPARGAGRPNGKAQTRRSNHSILTAQEQPAAQGSRKQSRCVCVVPEPHFQVLSGRISGVTQPRLLAQIRHVRIPRAFRILAGSISRGPGRHLCFEPADLDTRRHVSLEACTKPGASDSHLRCCLLCQLP